MQGFQGVNRKKVNAVINKNKRITIYAESGRVSMKKILQIAKEHADNGNYKAGFKAINEYRIALEQYHNEKLAQVIEIEAQLQQLKDDDDYKKDLIK